jgi:hypothetical protein
LYCCLYWHDFAAFRSAVASSSSFPAPPQPNWRGPLLSSPNVYARLHSRCVHTGTLHANPVPEIANSSETRPKHTADLSHETQSTIHSGFSCTMSLNGVCAPEADGEFDTAGAVIVRLQSGQSRPLCRFTT